MSKYIEDLSDKHKIPLYDMTLHLQAANRLNAPIEDYLFSLPKTQEEFSAYFKGTNKAKMAAVIWPGYK